MIAVKVLWRELWHFVEYLMTLLISYQEFQLKVHTLKYVNGCFFELLLQLQILCVWRGRFTPNSLLHELQPWDYICIRIMVGRLCRKSPAAWDSTSRKWLARVVTTLSHRGGRRRKTCNLNQQCRSNTTMWSISWNMHTNKCVKSTSHGPPKLVSCPDFSPMEGSSRPLKGLAARWLIDYLLRPILLWQNNFVTPSPYRGPVSFFITNFVANKRRKIKLVVKNPMYKQQLLAESLSECLNHPRPHPMVRIYVCTCDDHDEDQPSNYYRSKCL